MVVLTQKGENENLTKNIFRITGGNERLFTLIKPQGNDGVTARSLPPNVMACYTSATKPLPLLVLPYALLNYSRFRRFVGSNYLDYNNAMTILYFNLKI